MTEIQVSGSDSSTGIEDNDSIGWRSLPEIVSTSEDSHTCDTDKMVPLDNSFYRQVHRLSNLEYAKLKMSNFAVKLVDCELIITLFNTVATCSCISCNLFTKISG